MYILIGIAVFIILVIIIIIAAVTTKGEKLTDNCPALTSSQEVNGKMMCVPDEKVVCSKI